MKQKTPKNGKTNFLQQVDEVHARMSHGLNERQNVIFTHR